VSQDLLRVAIRPQSLSLILAQQFFDKVHSLRRCRETMPFLYRPLDRRFQYQLVCCHYILCKEGRDPNEHLIPRIQKKLNISGFLHYDAQSPPINGMIIGLLHDDLGSYIALYFQ
jgi:hypothetical protein